MAAILNEITQSYHAATIGWYSTLFPAANRLFGILAIIEIAWSGLCWTIEKQELSSLLSEFVRKIIVIGFFYFLLLHAQNFLQIINKSFSLLGANASHITKLDPTSVFDQGMSIAADIFEPLKKVSFLTHSSCYLIGGITSVVVTMCFAIIAGELVVTLIESYLVLGAGIFFLGFGSSRWTRDYTIRFLNYAMNVGCKLFFLYLIIGIGSNMTQHWGKVIATADNYNMLPFLEVLGGSLVYLIVTWTIPHKASNLMSGGLHSNMSNAVSTVTLFNSTVNSFAQQLRRSLPGLNQFKRLFNQKSGKK